MSTSTTLVLNCLLLGQGRDKIFPVEISGNKSVGSLRKVIKDERKRTLQFFEASDLKLWNVDVAVGEHFGEEEIEGLGLERKKSLGSMEKLSAIFSGKFTDGNLHIVVRHEREPVQLNLNCLVLSEKRNHIFLVEILSTQTVAALRNVIKDKKKAFHHVDTRTIILWRVSIPNDDSLELKLSRLNLVDEDSLSPTQELSEVYSNPPIRKHVHVIVKPPPARLPSQPLQASKFATIGKWTEGLTISQLEAAQDSLIKVMREAPSPCQSTEGLTISQLEAAQDSLIKGMREAPSPCQSTEGLTISQLEAVQDSLVKGMREAPSPSSAAAFNRFAIEQKARPIRNGRPPMNHGVPIQLYHPSFAKFLRIAREATAEIDVKPGAYSATHTLFYSSTVVYDDEARRIEATRVFLEEAIGHPIPALEASSGKITMRTNGACTAPCGKLVALVALKEDKNEVGTGGCDPSHQCAMGFRSYYTRQEMDPIRDRCCCPSFLIALAGPWICILGAVFVDHVVVQQLTDFIWIGGHPYDDDKLVSVTRILASLGAGITELRQFYGTLYPFGPIPDSQRFFPFIRQYSVGGRIVNFSYQGYLLKRTPESPPKAIFIATTEPEIGRESRKLVIKFVQRYNAYAHRILATKRCAPDLIYYSKEDPNGVDLAGLSMVIMEHIDGENAHQLYGNEPLPQTIFNQVEAAVGVLHEGNMVFGDLRYPNIMVEDGRAMFIDFDWCGEHEKDTYPVSLNDVRDTSNSINWHHKVERGGKMAKDHDVFMLNGMRPRSDITSLHNPPPATTSTQNRRQIRLGKRKARAPDNENEDV